jgi:hypothetical protein
MCRLVDTQDFLYLAARVKAGTGVETAKEFRETWRSLFPDSPYEEVFQDGVYKYHMTLGAFPFIMAAIIVFVTAILTIVSQVYNAAVRNPIDAIRYE